jgi:hypothetical protein
LICLQSRSRFFRELRNQTSPAAQFSPQPFDKSALLQFAMRSHLVAWIFGVVRRTDGAGDDGAGLFLARIE